MAANGLACNQPVERDPRVERRDTRGVGAGTDRHSGSEDLADRWGRVRGGLAVALDEFLAGDRDPILDGDAAAKRGDARDVAFADRLRMVEEPVQPGERNFAIDVLEDVEVLADRFVIRRM
jgi:hypothetical protein